MRNKFPIGRIVEIWNQQNCGQVIKLLKHENIIYFQPYFVIIITEFGCEQMMSSCFNNSTASLNARINKQMGCIYRIFII